MDSSIKVPKPTIKFLGLDNIEIVGKEPIPMSELFSLYLKLESFLKAQTETLTNEKGDIVGIKAGKRN